METLSEPGRRETIAGRDLAGRAALVTGGGRGIGLAVAEALAHAGAAVTILGRDDATLRAAAEAYGLRTILADVTDETALTAAVEHVGSLDILVNNAGGVVSAPLKRITAEAFRREIELNLTSVFIATRAAAPAMAARGWGRIVNIASTAGLKGYPYVSAYCAAKHGVVGLTRALALEFAATNVTINAICPGYADTGLIQDAVATIAQRTGRSADEARATFTAANPQGRLVQPREIASAVMWLCGENASAVTGQAISISGGEVT